MERETLTLTLYGLDAFNKDVDGEVFARKFFKFMQGLGEADQAANGSRRLKFLIDKLEKNTATAAVREQVSSGQGDHESGIKFYRKAVDDIYHNRAAARGLPVNLVKHVLELPKGLGKTFRRGEIKGANDNRIPIDGSLEANARRVLNEIQRLNLGKIAPFAGEAHISLDGTVIALDARGEGDKAIVILTAGGKQIDCHVTRIPEEQLRAIWKKRCVVRGVGHYSGNQSLPDYIDAVDIKPAFPGGNWGAWRGAIDAPPEGLDDWHQMGDGIKQYYWDTCVFIAHLADERDAYGTLIDDIQQFLDESMRGECVIHCSTISIAEITRGNCKGGQDFDEFLALFGGGIVPLSPDPNTMRMASELRSLIYTKTGGQRRLHTADAIHLASALTLEEAYGVSIEAFHTFDSGKRRDPEGKGVPLLGYDLWCEQCKDDPLAQRVIDMNRSKPLHPAKEMNLD